MRKISTAVRHLGHSSVLVAIAVLATACGGGSGNTSVSTALGASGTETTTAATGAATVSAAAVQPAALPLVPDVPPAQGTPPAPVGPDPGQPVAVPPPSPAMPPDTPPADPSPPPSPASPATPPAASSATVTAWVRVANDAGAFTLAGSQNVRYGDGIHWVTKTLAGTASCSPTSFGSDPAPWISKFCEQQVTVPAVVQSGTVPVVNTALLPAAAAAFGTPRVRALTAAELASSNFQTPATDVGAFREPCSYSHMAFDDPIAHPNAPGVSHLHTFVGNADVSAASTAASIAGSGASTCAGGTLNRTGYWSPTLVDMRTGQPVPPTGAIIYYKLGYLGVQAASVRAFPAGLRIIAGNANATPSAQSVGRFACLSGGAWQATIPNCAVGDTTRATVTFPQCWDGINLDSPDHKSHMAYATGSGCPADHPVALPEISIAFDYMNTEANMGNNFKLSSDNYAGTGGYSLHADWFNGWDSATLQDFVDHCIVGSHDCHAYLLGDGNTLF